MSPLSLILAFELMYLFIYFLKILFIFRGEGREKEKKRNIYMTEKALIGYSQLGVGGAWPATQAYALTRN